MKQINFNKKCISYNKQDVNKYLNDLKIVGSLSKLFSDKNIPLLYYRATENLYCLNFNAINISRDDLSIDAKLKHYGINIKTFVESNQKTFQKIAEFNNQQSLYSHLINLDKIKKITELRNQRLQLAKEKYNVKELLYHCIIRNKDGFYLFEETMNFINIENINLTTKSPHIYIFDDGIEEYKFDISKSTLYKRFKTNIYFAYIKVDILNNPIETLRKIIKF